MELGIMLVQTPLDTCQTPLATYTFSYIFNPPHTLIVCPVI